MFNAILGKGNRKRDCPEPVMRAGHYPEPCMTCVGTSSPRGQGNMRMLDLFAGLGGASQAFAARGWDVVTIDNDPRFGCTHTVDLAAWSYSGPPVDLVWASPPCTEFSRESMPWCRTGQVPSMELVEAARRIIAEVGPTWWVVENVRGATKHLNPLMGKPRSYGPFFLWGVFPPFACRVEPFKERLSSARRAERAKVPFALSESLAKACESQLGLFNLTEGAA